MRIFFLLFLGIFFAISSRADNASLEEVAKLYAEYLKKYAEKAPDRLTEWEQVLNSPLRKVTLRLGAVVWDLEKNAAIKIAEVPPILQARSIPMHQKQLVVVDKQNKPRLFALLEDVVPVENDLDLATDPKKVLTYGNSGFNQAIHRGDMNGVINFTSFYWTFNQMDYLEPFYHTANLWGSGIRFDNHTFYHFSKVPFHFGISGAYDYSVGINIAQGHFEEKILWLGPSFFFDLPMFELSLMLGLQRSFYYSLQLFDKNQLVSLVAHNFFIGLNGSIRESKTFYWCAQYQRRYILDSNNEQVFSPYANARNLDQAIILGVGLRFDFNF